MDIEEIAAKIDEIFIQEPYRQIVFWYDGSKEFVEDINDIQLENGELYILKEDNWIYTKYYIEIEKKDILHRLKKSIKK